MEPSLPSQSAVYPDRWRLPWASSCESWRILYPPASFAIAGGLIPASIQRLDKIQNVYFRTVPSKPFHPFPLVAGPPREISSRLSPVVGTWHPPLRKQSCDARVTGNSVLHNPCVMSPASAGGCREGLLVFGRGERPIMASVGGTPPIRAAPSGSIAESIGSSGNYP